ncbi:MAG: glycoside hydrolase family 16 protein, partial [Candidatus Cloacimonetes bacterium]|nr:glycoside hydrolase family 16 protein [Candidatus Cloacimonadota bacterium]
MAGKIARLIILAACFSFIIGGCDHITDPDNVQDPTIPASYELVWSDEFDQETLDPENWGYDLGYGENGWGNDEWQLYTDSSENVKVENGNLVISAIWDSTNFTAPGKRDGSISSARMNTKNKFSFKYGKIQARIKAPTGMGMWPAFWMLGTNFDTIGWPKCGEIDIMEISPLLHGDQTTMCTMHWWDDNIAAHNSYGTRWQLSEVLSDGFHTFEVEWDEQRVIGKIDDITYFVKVIEPDIMDEFLRKFFLIFNVAVGGNLGGAPDETTQWPQNMYVDWVRVYQTEENLIPVETFGIYTDLTPVDDALTIGSNAEIYVWENTLTGGSIPPYEGDNVISWTTTGQGWFGGGISSLAPIDLSGFAAGTINFMIKIPANVSFKIGINDAAGNESYVDFPAGQTVFGLERNGEWGQAIIPVADIQGNVDLQMLSYEFMILEENGTQCQFAIDD